jgi:hypothetical protein
MKEVLGEGAPPEEPETEPEPKERSAILMELIVWQQSALRSDWPNFPDKPCNQLRATRSLMYTVLTPAESRRALQPSKV